MVHKHYKSGLDFIVDQVHKQRDWIAFLTSLNVSGGAGRSPGFKNKRNGILKNSKTDSCSSGSMSSLDGEHQGKTVHFCLSPGGGGQAQLEETYDRLMFGWTPNTLPTKAFEPADIIWRFWKWTNEDAAGEHFSPNSSAEIMTSSLRNMFSFKDRLQPSNVHVYSTFALHNLSAANYPNLFDYFEELATPMARVQRGQHRSPPKALCSYFVFKNGVPPLWEDEFNVNGGRWQTTIYPQRALDSATIKAVWRELLLMLTESMVPYLEEVCGIALTVRANGSYKISVWNRDASNTIVKLMIGQLLKEALGSSHSIYYYFSHQTTIDKIAARRRAQPSPSAVVLPSLLTSGLRTIESYLSDPLSFH